MTLHGHRQPRRRSTGLQRWLLGIGTLLIALGVVVMHSLGIGHHGSIHPAPGDRPAVTPGAVVAHEVAGHDARVLAPIVTSARHTASHSEGHSASHRASLDTSHDTAAYGSMVAERAVAAAAGMSHGATAMCVAVLPLLVLLGRRGARAWFARRGRCPTPRRVTARRLVVRRATPATRIDPVGALHPAHVTGPGGSRGTLPAPPAVQHQHLLRAAATHAGPDPGQEAP